VNKEDEDGASPPPKGLGEGGVVTMVEVKNAEDPVAPGDEEKMADS